MNVQALERIATTCTPPVPHAARACETDRSIMLLTRYSDADAVARYAGNKARSLHRLDGHGFDVPQWVALGTQAFERFKDASGISSIIETKLAHLNAADEAQFMREISLAAEHIHTCLAAASLDEQIEDLINAAYLQLTQAENAIVTLAVRSSGVEEDGDEHSFAGQFDSVLNVTGVQAVMNAVKQCWASTYSERSLIYRKRCGMALDGARMGVIVQRMVAADTSGVTFTANPLNGNPFEIVVSSVYGLGEGLVSGQVDADTVTLAKSNGALLHAAIGEKTHRYCATGVIEVDATETDELSLGAKEFEQLHALAIAIEDVSQCPVDIEWAFQDGKLWTLQARPITNAKLWPRGELRIWDNSNIVENYPGLSAPLTFSLTSHLYTNVFREYCRKLLIPHRQLREMEDVLQNLVGHLNGQIYYNLLNWYRLVGVNPMPKTGQQMLELQMGLNVSLASHSNADPLEPYRCSSNLRHFAVRTLTGCRFMTFLLGLRGIVSRFTQAFYPVYERYDNIDYDGMDADEIYTHYKRFEAQVIELWGVTVAIESSIGLPYGVLKALTKRWIPDAPGWFEVALLGEVGGVESLEPVRELERIADWVGGQDTLRQTVEATPSHLLYAHLRDTGEHALLAEIDEYIRRFGYRSQNELKLEEPDLRQKPGLLFDMLKSSLKAKHCAESNKHTGDCDSVSTESRVEEIIRANLRPWQRVLFRAVRKKVHVAIASRETVRFCRSRVFGVFRNMFLAMGASLARSGTLDSAKDVFSLNLDELKHCLDGKRPAAELRASVELRKAQFEHYANCAPLPSRFVTRGSTGEWLANFAGTLGNADTDHSGVLNGITCCSGNVTDVASVVDEPNEFERGILVTYRTDPGWVVVFPQASGILIERGSPLAHASIVARELNIPTLVQIPNLLANVEQGMTLRIDGDAGAVHLSTAREE